MSNESPTIKPTSAALITLQGVTCAYGSAAVLTDINFEIVSNQFTGIVGPSGSGKTTLLRVLLGNVRPVAGTVRRRAAIRDWQQSALPGRVTPSKARSPFAPHP